MKRNKIIYKKDKFTKKLHKLIISCEFINNRKTVLKRITV